MSFATLLYTVWMNTSFDGSFKLIFWLSERKRTEDKIFTHATNTAANKSLKYEHRLVMLSECFFDMALDQFWTSLRRFW